MTTGSANRVADDYCH